MSWKYVMLQVGDRAMPIIFPSELIHSHVAGAMQLAVEATDPQKDLRPRQCEQMLERGTAPVRSAGFLEGLACAIAMGESESLGVKSDDDDTQLINNHPYEKGMLSPLGNVTEALLLQKTAQLLLLRKQEIGG